jgi:hypothetical protein
MTPFIGPNVETTVEIKLAKMDIGSLGKNSKPSTWSSKRKIKICLRMSRQDY